MANHELILSLHDMGAIKFGEFMLKNGMKSPVYFDFRDVPCYPKLLRTVAEALWQAGSKGEARADSVCGVPIGGIAFCTVIADHHEVPMVIKRKEEKSYGDKKLIHGERVLTSGSRCMIVEDVVTTGASILETAKALRAATDGALVEDAVVILDREQGGRQKLLDGGIRMHTVLTTSELLSVLHQHGRVTDEQVQSVKEFLKENQC